MVYDKIIIGAGLYGLYAAHHCGKKGEKILVLEWDDEPFARATYINQARVHMGYHYPRSISTALKSAHYFERFNEDFRFCIHSSFDQIYAMSSAFSWTDAKQFKQFCQGADIFCEDAAAGRYFKEGMCDGAFLTKEYTYDAQILKEFLLEECARYKNIEIRYGQRIRTIESASGRYLITLAGGVSVNERTIHNPDLSARKSGRMGVSVNEKAIHNPDLSAPQGRLMGVSAETGFVLNATYASVNQLLNLVGFEAFKIKYELCEIILCEVNEQLNNIGITVMDGPFFSIMPFGKTGLHSLTSVTFTPHETSYDVLPSFSCQERSAGYCSSRQLGNCNLCPQKPKSAWESMNHLAKKYLKDEFAFTYKQSLFSMKPVLKQSEVDDSRPTVVRIFSQKPTFVSVLSGKINTVYDLDAILDGVEV